jgi:hypothetical protein
MPIVINEVVIRVTVASRPDDSQNPGAEHCEPTSGTGGTADELVEKVFEILKSKRER